MGKRRNTGKTGDKSLYKKAAEARKQQSAEATSRPSRLKDDKDDHMYDEVDKYHNKLDENFLKFDDGDDQQQNDSDDNSEEEVEAVMDLGVGGGDDSSSSDDDDSDDSEPDTKGGRQQEELSSSSSDDDDDDDDDHIEDVRDWGKKKSAYYHGDTADLELGQDVEDAFLEGEGVKELQKARLEEMDEEDFMPSDDDDEDKKDSTSSSKKLSADREMTTTKMVSSIRDISKLSSKDRRKLLDKQHPGLLQITSHFSGVVQSLKDCTNVAANALFEGGDEATAEAVGATKMGQMYLLTKALIESSTALNLAMFLLLKSEESGSTSSSAVQFHPVMKRLQEFNVLGQKLKSKVQDKVDGLDEQMESLMKAAELMQSMGTEEEEDDEDDDDNDDDNKESDNHQHDRNRDIEMVDSKDLGATTSGVASSSSSSSSDDEESSVDEEAISQRAIHNARFGLRPNEMAQDSAPKRKRRRGVPSDLGDDDADLGGSRKGASRYLSSAINSIEQRTASKKKKNRGASSEELVDQRDADDELRRGLEMMEAELGKFSDDDDDEEDGEALADDIDSDEDGGFYSSMAKKSKRKKAIKKSLYQVAPKYPRLEGEVEGERAISRAIMKNRGLVPHKNKLNRNPRVKKREQYRKALIRRKGAVREVRTDEGHKYGGEETGIKRGISRSRKLGAK